VIDVDCVAKDIYQTDESAVRDISNSFGQFIFSPDGKIDYRILGNTVFSSKNELDKLNSIMFPRIGARVLEILKASKEKKYIIIDAAVLFDASLDRFCDIIILVKAGQQFRKKMLKSKCSLSDREIEARIKGQYLNINEKALDHVIENNGSRRSFYRKIKEAAGKITGYK